MIKVYKELEQGSEEWVAVRCGRVCASEVKLIMTPTLKVAANAKSRAHVYEIAAQRISGYVEPAYISDDMLRGKGDEVLARIKYDQNYGPVTEVGFVSNDKFGFTIGYSPDGLIGEHGQIEIKSRRQAFQVETIAADEMPTEYFLQVQTGLMVTERLWCDFISYSGGLPMFVHRAYPDLRMQEAIVDAALSFELQVEETMKRYAATRDGRKLIPTERQSEIEITL